jgi:hypothetical protein
LLSCWHRYCCDILTAAVVTAVAGIPDVADNHAVDGVPAVACSLLLLVLLLLLDEDWMKIFVLAAVIPFNSTFRTMSE